MFASLLSLEICRDLSLVVVVLCISYFVTEVHSLQHRLSAYQLHARSHAQECETCRLLLDVDEVDRDDGEACQV